MKTFKPFHVATSAQSITIAKRTSYAMELAQALGLLDPDTEAWIKARIEDKELATRDSNALNNKLHCPNQYARFAFTDIKTAQKARKGGRLSLQHDSSSQFEKEYNKQ